MIMQKALAISQPTIQRRFLEHLSRVSYRAKCFLFDHDSSRLIGQFATECSDLIFDHRQFAKPPYDVTYIEYDNVGMMTGMHGNFEPWEDTRVGFLIYLSTVYVFVSQNKELGTPELVWPLFYYCAERGSKVDHKSSFPVVDYGSHAPVGKLVLIMGSGLNFLAGDTMLNPAGPHDGEAFASFEQAIEAGIKHHIGGRTKMGKIMEDLINSNEAYFAGTKQTLPFQTGFLRESIGDLRKVWAGLLWLQSVPKTVTMSPVPAGHTMHHGKRVAMSAHHTVHIHLRGKRTIRQRYLAAHHKRNSPRLHDVRGHHKHRGGAAIGCSHVWPPTPNEKGQFICEKCERKRWFVKAFKRGDESKGFVDKDYQLEI